MVSCMIVSDDCIRAIVDEAMPTSPSENGISNYGRFLDLDAPFGAMRTGFPESVYDDPSALGVALQAANYRAMLDRYGDVDPPAESYRHRKGLPLPAVRVLAMLDCFEYQLLDWKAFNDRENARGAAYRAFIEAVRKRSIQRLPGYSWTD